MRALPVALVLTLLACGEDAPIEPRAQPVPIPAPSVPPTEATATEPTATAPPTPDDSLTHLGVSLDVAPLSDDALAAAARESAEGARLIAAGDDAAARTHLEEALRQDPGLDGARFALAGVLARAGAGDAAEAAIFALLEHDLTTWAVRIDDDDALAEVRARAWVVSRRMQIEHDWADAMRIGLPASLAIYGRGVRHGFYLRDVNRFLAAVPQLPPGEAVLDAGRRRIAYAHVETVGDIEPDYVWAITEVGVVGLGPTGLRHAAAPRGETIPAEHDLWARIDATDEAVQFAGWEIHGTRMRQGRAGRRARRDEAPPPGITLRGNALALADGTSIELGVGHAASSSHSFVPSPDGRRLIVASTRDHGEEPVEFEQYATIHRTFVDHVDLDTRVVTRLGLFDGHPVVVAHDGDAYVASAPRARRYAGFRAEAEDLPAGLAPMPVFVAAD